MAVNVQSVFLKRNNLISLQFKKDGVVVTLTNITRARLIMSPHVELDYNVDNSIFDWTTTNTQLDIALGSQNIPEGVYLDSQIVLYDAQHTSGVVWGKIDVIVQDGMIT